MKYTNIGILIPYETTEGERAMVRFRLKGTADRRWIRKQIKKQFKPLGIVPQKHLIDYYVKHRQYDLGIE